MMLLYIIKNKNRRIVGINANKSLYRKTLHNDKKDRLSLWRVFLIMLGLRDLKSYSKSVAYGMK
jgi:hypothetical protein